MKVIYLWSCRVALFLACAHAVVTATPTGFTITDITGQDVLVSEQTPSPITAIAVDLTSALFISLCRIQILF